LRSQPKIVQGKRVLEIGAGLGAVGFCSAELGADQIVMTDCGYQTLIQLSETLIDYHLPATEEEEEEKKELKGSDDQLIWESKNVLIRFHLWEEDLEFIEAKQENRSMDTIYHWSKADERYQQIPSLSFKSTFDLMLGSDLLYFASQERPLLATIQLHLAQNGLALILQTIRTNNGAVFRRFVQAAKEIFDVRVRDITSDEVTNAIDYHKGDLHDTQHTVGYKLVTIQFKEKDIIEICS
jgi:predicted nicotinamide N-methyase